MFPLQMLCTVLLNGNLRSCPKMGLHPSPELRGIQLPRVHLFLPSPPVPWLYGCTLPRKDTRGHVDPADTMPKPTQGRRKGVFLCQQTCSTHQATSEHPWSPFTPLEAALFLANKLLPHPLLASLPHPYPCHLGASSWPTPTLFLWTLTSQDFEEIPDVPREKAKILTPVWAPLTP